MNQGATMEVILEEEGKKARERFFIGVRQELDGFVEFAKMSSFPSQNPGPRSPERGGSGCKALRRRNSSAISRSCNAADGPAPTLAAGRRRRQPQALRLAAEA